MAHYLIRRGNGKFTVVEATPAADGSLSFEASNPTAIKLSDVDAAAAVKLINETAGMARINALNTFGAEIVARQPPRKK